MGRSITTARGPLPDPTVHFHETTLTQYAGAIPLMRYLQEDLRLPQQLAAAVRTDGRTRRHPVSAVLYAFLVGSLLGVARLAHLEWLRGDAVLLKFLRLTMWPVRKVFSEALASVQDAGIGVLLDLLTRLGLYSLTGVSEAILDFDSTALRCFGTQEGALFGYCGKGRNRRRHHPLVASVAATRAVVHAKYRDGSAIDENEAMAFIGEAVARVRGARSGSVKVRADSGFWSKAMGAWLLRENIPFAFAMPLLTSLKVLLWGATFLPVPAHELVPRDEDTDEDDLGEEEIEVAELRGSVLGYDDRLRIIVIRRRVFDAKAPPPGKVVQGSSDWRYQAIVTSLDWEPLDVWRFYNDRGDAERVFKVGKHALGLGWLIGQDFRANTVAFLLRLIAWNADLLFQQEATRRARAAERPVLRMGLQARQQYLYRLAGRLLRASNRWKLSLPANDRVARMWHFYASGAPTTS